MSLTHRGFVDFTELTLADEDTNSILTDNANRAIQGNVAMHATWWPTLETLQGTSPDDQILNQFAIHPKRWCPQCQDSADNFEFSAERLSENAKSIKITLYLTDNANKAI